MIDMGQLCLDFKFPLSCHEFIVLSLNRWDSTYLLLESNNNLKPALIQTLSNVDAPVEITQSDWKLTEKVLTVLKLFHDSTKKLSAYDASISMVIPIVTTIMKGLNVSDADHGVKTMKRALMANMERRFETVEDQNDYAVATLLDCKYKSYFFRKPGTLERVKGVVIDELVNAMRELGPQVNLCAYHACNLYRHGKHFKSIFFKTNFVIIVR